LRAAPPGIQDRTDSDGGFAVPSAFITRLFERAYNTSEILLRVTRVDPPERGNEILFPGIDESSRAIGSRFGGARAYWVEEAAAIADSLPKVVLHRRQLNKVAVLFYATDELLEDAPMANLFAERVALLELSTEIERCIVRGTGSGQPLGLVNSPAKITVSKTVGQTAATISAANIRAMFARLWGPCWNRAVWLCNESTADQLLSMAGTLVTFDREGILLAGRPVLACEHCSALGTEGDLILTDLGEFIFVDRAVGAWSAHVRFLNYESAFRLTARVDGRSLWASALTPANGSGTLSSIITLETRS
jgi:HK97 family phage major capsid protein